MHLPTTKYGAGLDVFAIEPTGPRNPLFALDNVVSTPHIAGKTSESYPRRLSFAFENMLAVWKGKPPKSEIT
jgi:D-3-phosphoglycerate dehydrogenase